MRFRFLPAKCSAVGKRGNAMRAHTAKKGGESGFATRFFLFMAQALVDHMLALLKERGEDPQQGHPGDKLPLGPPGIMPMPPQTPQPIPGPPPPQSQPPPPPPPPAQPPKSDRVEQDPINKIRKTLHRHHRKHHRKGSGRRIRIKSNKHLSPFLL